MKKMNSLLVKGFQTSKCKTQLRLGTARINLLRNKKGKQIVSDRKEVADLLSNGQENNARLLVQRVIMEQDLIEAYDLLYLYAEQIVARLSVIESQKTCPLDLKEDISTLLYASSRCAELTDFSQIHPMFVAKYGKEFVSAAIELRPGCGVSAKVVEKLSSNGSTGEKKLKLMKEIAAEHNVVWDPTPFEREVRGDYDDVLPGPTVFTRADTSSISVDDFPCVPSRKPTLGTHVSQPANVTNSISGRFDKVEPANSPRPGDYRTDSSGSFSRTGPPSRKPPGRNQSSSEGLTSDERHPDIDPGSKETQSRRNQRRESDSFLAPYPQGRHEVEESRRNSIGVPREKSVRAHTGSAHADADESSLQDHKKHNLRDADSDDFDEASQRKGRREVEESRRNSIRVPREKSVRAHTGSAHADADESSLQDHKKHNLRDADSDDFDEASQRKGRREVEESRRNSIGVPREKSVRAHTASADVGADEPSLQGHKKYSLRDAGADDFDEARLRKGSHGSEYKAEFDDRQSQKFAAKEVSERRRPQHRDQYADDDKVRVPSSGDGSGKRRPHQEDQYADDDKVRVPLSGDGSGKRRPHQEDQYVDNDKVRVRSSRDGSGKRRPQQEDQYADDDEVRVRSSRDGSGKRWPDLEDRRATIGPEEIRRAGAWDSEDPPRSRFGEMEKQVESRRQSAPLPKEDVIEGRPSQRERTDRHHNADNPPVYVGPKPSRFGPQVSVQKDDDYLPNTRAFDGQRKAENPVRYDDGRPPPRFIKVGNQPNLDDEDVQALPTSKGEKPQRFVTGNDQPTPRPRSNLQTAKTDPALSGPPKTSSFPEHRKSHSAFAESSSKSSTPRPKTPSAEETHTHRQAGQPPSKPPFLVPTTMDSLIQMFAKNNLKK